MSTNFAKTWIGNRTMTSNCDVTISAHQIQMTTLCHWMKPPPWKFSAYANGALTHARWWKAIGSFIWPLTFA